jgi:predicted nucleic acid-binding Zn ribbon protein
MTHAESVVATIQRDPAHALSDATTEVADERRREQRDSLHSASQPSTVDSPLSRYARAVRQPTRPPAFPPPRPKRDPEVLADLVPRVLQEIGLGGASDAARLVRAWDEALGADLARHCRPLGVRRGVVFATVPDSAWMQRFQLEKPRILARLRAELGAEIAHELRARIATAADR